MDPQGSGRIEDLTQKIARYERAREDLLQRRCGMADSAMVVIDDRLEVNERSLAVLKRSLELATAASGDRKSSAGPPAAPLSSLEVALRPIMVVDDEPEDLFIAKRYLGKAGIKNPTVTFESGDTAIAFLSARSSGDEIPCLLILDIKMPMFDGFQILAWARAQGALRTMKIVMHSSSSLPEDVARAVALGADDFLVKPVSSAKWLEVVPNPGAPSPAT